MIRAMHRATDGRIRTDLTPGQFAAALEDLGGLLWVDFQGEPNESSEPILRQTFGFHPLAIDDALQESHIPRVDDWVDYLYVVLHAVSYQPEDGHELSTLELDVFLGKNYMVTHHDQPIPAVDDLWERCQRAQRPLENGTDHLLYELADRMVARYMPVIESLDDSIDELEAEIFDGPASDTLERLFQLKQAVIYLRRIIGPQREVFNRLARDEYRVINPQRRVYFRDIYDHLVRLHDTGEGMRDLVVGVMDTYLSVVNNRLSDVMKTLTIITTLFMPVSFLASFFGMNFFAPAEPPGIWTSRVLLLATVTIMTLIPLLMYGWVRRRGWM